MTNPRDARRIFGATLVLEGSIQRSGPALRVTYALVDTATLAQIDAFTSAASQGDPFALYDSVAQWALTSLSLKVNGPERQAITLPGTSVPRAYELALVGRGYLLDYHVPGNIDRAIQLFREASELDPRFSAAYAGLGQAFWLRYDATKNTAWVAEARQACERAVSLESQAAPAYVCLGTVQVGTGQYDAAVEAFQRALERDPSSDEAYLGLARAQEGQGRKTDAEQTYRRAVALRPQYWAAHTRLGTFFRNQGRYREAATEFERAIELTPDNAQAHLILGGLNIYLGNYQSAIASFRRSVALGPTTQAYSNWGMTYFRMRRFDEAVTTLETARGLEPTNYRTLSNLARAYHWAGRRAEATSTCASVIAMGREQLRVNARATDVHLLMAECLAKNGDADGARTALQLSEVTLESEPHSVLFVAMIYNQLGARDTALEWLRRAAGNGLPAAELRSWIEIDNLRGDPGFPAPAEAR